MKDSKYSDTLNFYHISPKFWLTLKAPITTAADDNFFLILFYFQRKQVLTVHVNCLFGRLFIWNVKTCFLWKIKKKFECRLLQILLGALWVKSILIPMTVSKSCCMNVKQCGGWCNAVFCCVSSGSVRPRWLSWMRRPTGDQEVAGSTPAEVGSILSWRLIMKYFLRSFSPFRWFKKGSCQFLAKECAHYWLTA